MENWIKKEVIIDFDVPSSVQYLIDLCVNSLLPAA